MSRCPTVLSGTGILKEMSDGGVRLFRFVMWRSTAKGIRALLVSATVLAVAAACSDSPDPKPGSTTTTTPPVTATTAAAAPTTRAFPSPTYTKPPSRNLTRPPGVAPLGGTPCSFALGAIHIFAASWAANQVGPVMQGRKVADSEWTEAAGLLGGYHDGIENTRSRMKDAHVPQSFAVFSDLADADTAISEAVEAAKAKDESNVMSIFVKSLAAEDHLVESCGALG
jgi:hypothetical protein